MKKFAAVLSILLIVSMVFSPLCYAAGTNSDTLVSWGIKVVTPDNTSAVLKGGTYYIYGQQEGYIPYVMLAPYNYSSAEKFLEDFTDQVMKTKYSDLKITSDISEKTVGGKDCWEIDYSYSISGLKTVDRRIAIEANGMVYMFASKEIESKGWTLGSLLEDVVAWCEFLPLDGSDEPDDTGDDSDGSFFDNELEYGYLYCQEDGMPKYWLDLTGTIIDQPVLHCYFRSSDPTFYESYYILDMETADEGSDYIAFHHVSDSRGFDVSNWFKVLTFIVDGDHLLMDVERDEKTLAGGTEDNVFTGTYDMEPADVGVVYEYYDDNGMLKYWMVGLEEAIELHCMFISGDPEYYEEVFYLDLLSAERDGDYSLKIKKVTDHSGRDVSKWFKSLTLNQVQTSYILNVKRDEKTLAGGAGDNILTGAYTFDAHTHFCPLEKGPFSIKELGVLAQRYYFKNNFFFPPEVEVTRNKGGTYTIHLYEVVDLDGVKHTATSAWYTVDRYGVGTDDINDCRINLTE